MTESITAFAPATTANVAVGFDILGFAIAGVGDRVRVGFGGAPGEVTIDSITGLVPQLPKDPTRNTASVALLELLRDRPLDRGLCITIDKGIPLGSGMGGSAASAVAAVVAANRLLGDPLTQEEMLHYSMAGERVASGAAHPDNAAASLYGGMVAVVGVDPPRVVPIPVPDRLINVLVHPHLEIETRRAREVLPRSVALSDHVEQTMRLTGVLAGCFAGDLELIGRSLVDHLVESSRAVLIPGFDAAKDAAGAAGALGFGISGSGPSVFAWTDSDATACRVERDVLAAFAARDVGADAWRGPIERRGAHVPDDAGR